jgi:hypothetical protein
MKARGARDCLTGQALLDAKVLEPKPNRGPFRESPVGEREPDRPAHERDIIRLNGRLRPEKPA